jgi:hypothetical protein
MTDDITLKPCKVTAFGIKYVGDRWWHEDLADRVGETVYIHRESLPPFSTKGLKVFDHDVDLICEARRLENPHRLLDSFPAPAGEGE